MRCHQPLFLYMWYFNLHLLISREKLYWSDAISNRSFGKDHFRSKLFFFFVCVWFATRIVSAGISGKTNVILANTWLGWNIFAEDYPCFSWIQTVALRHNIGYILYWSHGHLFNQTARKFEENVEDWDLALDWYFRKLFVYPSNVWPFDLWWPTYPTDLHIIDSRWLGRLIRSFWVVVWWCRLNNSEATPVYFPLPINFSQICWARKIEKSANFSVKHRVHLARLPAPYVPRWTITTHTNNSRNVAPENINKESVPG